MFPQLVVVSTWNKNEFRLWQFAPEGMSVFYFYQSVVCCMDDLNFTNLCLFFIVMISVLTLTAEGDNLSIVGHVLSLEKVFGIHPPALSFITSVRLVKVLLSMITLKKMLAGTPSFELS
jgi:hypothetical protein